MARNSQLVYLKTPSEYLILQYKIDPTGGRLGNDCPYNHKNLLFNFKDSIVTYYG